MSRITFAEVPTVYSTDPAGHFLWRPLRRGEDTDLTTEALRHGGSTGGFNDFHSYAMKSKLAPPFLGQFTKFRPAAVELHATFSGLEDELTEVILSPDKEDA